MNALSAVTPVPLDVAAIPGNRIGEPHQHTALLRSDGLLVVAWNQGVTGHNQVMERALSYNNFFRCCHASCNNSGTISVQDIFDFLAAYFAGC